MVSTSRHEKLFSIKIPKFTSHNLSVFVFLTWNPKFIPEFDA